MSRDKQSDRARRPFWIHQFAEYLTGMVLVSLIFQDAHPEMPVAVGIVMILNAASVRGPLGAFATIGRKTHRVIDLAVAALCVGAAIQPWVEVSAMGAFALIGILVPYLSSWYYTDWDEKPQRTARRIAKGSDRSASIGRGAGRVAGVGWSKLKRSVGGDDDT